MTLRQQIHEELRNLSEFGEQESKTNKIFLNVYNIISLVHK
jgi:hypothetical protein